ncbi:zinc-binding dehydrogenase [Streptomyces sp. NPDC059096]|uniref:zinc-binding dehydrogenase n=1 Tax=Streptomyces sp. NPDC059096 TaxID=3346727 RepID=UPI003683BB29
MLLVFFGFAGAGIGCVETAESALVAQLLPDRLRGSGFGLLGAVQAVGGPAMAFVASGLASGTIRPVIDRVFDGLDEMPAAHRYLESNAQVGKVVVRVR